MSSQLAEPTTNMDTDIPTQSSTQAPNNTSDILNELNDRERKKPNLVVYNLPEGSDWKADIKTFHTLSMNQINVMTS